MGLSHGTDVWKGNAQDLIKSGICTIEEVIGCRDSIMTGLIYNGLPPKDAFDIMERVRKGKSLSEDQENLMRQKKVPDWYIESCKKIRYMFPKAHAAAYTISSLRIAWFKINHPEAYYCAYFTVRADEFDSQLMCLPAAQIRQAREKLRHELRDGGDREQRIYYILELVEEMQLRGIDFVPIDLHRSDATRFIAVAPGRILPPLNAVPSISLAVAGQIVKARSERPFKTRDDLARRAGVSQAVMDNLAAGGCLADLPESSQISLFELLA
jgi:DNA polymerase-3 subunit alpha (Gram-positive type)